MQKSMTGMYYLMGLFIIHCLYPRTDAGASINDTKTLLKDVLGKHSRFIRPVADQDEVLNVTVSLRLKTLKEVDEVEGTLSVTGALYISWPDALVQWNPLEYGGATRLKLRYKEVWVPDMILMNPAEDSDTLGKPWQVVQYFHYGLAMWNPGGLIETSCEIDVRYYPFDTQVCEAQFTIWGYNSEEIRIIQAYDKADLSLYTQNPSWELVDTSTKSWTFASYTPGFLCRIHLKRKPGFVIINIIIPILFLSLLNVLVFVLVPDSGERVSYSITVLLAVAVFLTIVSDTLPKSSEPIPLISHKIMLDMMISASITSVTILNLHFYHKSDDNKVPASVQALYRCLTIRRCCKSSPVSPTPIPNTNHTPKLESSLKKKSKDVLTISECVYPVNEIVDDTINEVVMDVDSDQLPQVTWRQVSRMLDRLCLITFTFISVVSFASFILVSALI